MTFSLQSPESFPSTRYQGSKRKLLGLLFDVFSKLEFDTALDPFSGTGSVAYLLKTMNKSVIAGDLLECNAISARALIENDEVVLGDDIEKILKGLPDDTGERGFVENTFEGIFFETQENRFIDQVLPRIHSLPPMKRELALYSLFQACLAKRPYNLFHRANLYMRHGDVKRSFGNKATWDTTFHEHMRRYAGQADQAVFASKNRCTAYCSDVMDVDARGIDLVYLDPPYVSAKGTGVDYLDFYHFLEGLSDPQNWPSKVLHKYKHKPIVGRGSSDWSNPNKIADAFESAIDRFKDSIIVISYRSDGIPGIDEIVGLLGKHNKRVEIVDAGRYTYALSRNKRSREVVLLAG